VPALVDRETGSVLMLVDDQAEAETLVVELRSRGVRADIVTLPTKVPGRAATGLPVPAASTQTGVGRRQQDRGRFHRLADVPARHRL
jgi:hypothetical protein